ncbi:hypothetical protein HY988_01790 [Candidatus Micrarchaeota archaeon]|nr:hypothetical protein [Candidatus Micrarchaeota archaeon]
MGYYIEPTNRTLTRGQKKRVKSGTSFQMARTNSLRTTTSQTTRIVRSDSYSRRRKKCGIASKPR